MIGERLHREVRLLYCLQRDSILILECALILKSTEYALCCLIVNAEYYARFFHLQSFVKDHLNKSESTFIRNDVAISRQLQGPGISGMIY